MKAKQTKVTQVDEEQMVSLVRNALLVAGHEMGETGDHWPVIKSTIHQIMKDWEDVKIDRNVDAELKIHLYEQLEIMEKGLNECPADVRDEVARDVKELREMYDAYFSSLDANAVIISDEEIPSHIKRAKNIIGTLEEENG